MNKFTCLKLILPGLQALQNANDMTYLIPQLLETDRLILRMFRENDSSDLHLFYSDPVCTRYTIGRPFTEEETKQKVRSLIAHWDKHQYGSYALEEQATGRVIGVAGLDYPDDWPEPEIQWGLSRNWWGRGYASEAVRAVKKMSHWYIPRLSLISLIHPENKNSINLALAVGAYFEKEYFFRGDTWHIYRHAALID